MRANKGVRLAALVCVSLGLVINSLLTSCSLILSESKNKADVDAGTADANDGGVDNDAQETLWSPWRILRTNLPALGEPVQLAGTLSTDGLPTVDDIEGNAFAILTGSTVSLENLTISGNRPLVVVADAIRINGVVRVAAGRVPIGECMTTAPAAITIGGPGGSGASRGGSGGSSAGPLLSAATSTGRALAGGCSGQVRFVSGVGVNGSNGPGGGAIQLIAFEEIFFESGSSLGANGQGGGAGGGGGGAGGMIVLDSPQVIIGMGATVSANGGGGGGGGGAKGNDADTNGGQGGQGSIPSQNGGNGGGGAPATEAQDGGLGDGTGGGGGGGGFGFVFTFDDSQLSIADADSIRPPATSAP